MQHFSQHHHFAGVSNYILPELASLLVWVNHVLNGYELPGIAINNFYLHVSKNALLFIITCTLADMKSAEFYHLHEFCSAALCDDPVNIDNSTVSFDGNSVGDMATYMCDSGFELIGNATTICTLVDIDSAEFQPVPPSCRREYR